MPEYVEREPLLAEYDREHEGPPGRARELIANAPAADVVPVRNGRWIKEIFNDGYGDYPLYVCSECRAQSARKRNFCYDCGAKMDMEVDNG